MGLGVLGGGLATVKWLVRRGAKVTVTDLRPREELVDSIKKLGSAALPSGRRAQKIIFVLGRHRLSDFQNNEIIVVNPAVRRESEFLRAAQKAGRTLTNDARIFFETVENPIIAVTGTRGKTTTVNWIAHLLKGKYPEVIAAGNSSETALLDLAGRLPDKETPVVIELSSWQLEFLKEVRRAPDIAVITNIYPDHLNRYSSLNDYALAKANVFGNQTVNNFLILNQENKWTKFFLKKKPAAKTYFFSATQSAISFEKNNILPAGFLNKFSLEKGEHNVANLLAAAAAARLSGLSWPAIKERIKSLPTLLYRQEAVLKKGNLTVINDSAGTSPDAVVAAIERFRKQGRVFLIAGGTDKNLVFDDLARKIKENIPSADLFLLNGSATKKLLKSLEKTRYFRNQSAHLFEDLENILKAVRFSLDQKKGRKEKIFIIFSPGAASFEKFKNEFDRGEKFNLLIEKIIK